MEIKIARAVFHQVFQVPAIGMIATTLESVPKADSRGRPAQMTLKDSVLHVEISGHKVLVPITNVVYMLPE